MKFLLIGPVLFSLCSILPRVQANRYISVCTKVYKDAYVKRWLHQRYLGRVRSRGGGLVGEQVPGLKPGYAFGEDCQPYLANPPIADLCCDPYERPSFLACFEGIECCPNTGKWSCSIGDGKTYPCGDITITGDYGEACDCPRDTKTCLDGTQVKRDPYNQCEFAPCQDGGLDCDSCPCGFFDGCNACGCGNGEFPICTLAVCTPDQLRPTSCDTCDTPSCATCPCGYNDGCNDCFCEEGIPSCTARYCFWKGEPSCIEDCQCQDDRDDCPDGSFVTQDPENNCQFRPCPSPRFCTQEVKTCPDGSSVGRDPFNGCAFFPCPVANCCDPDERPGANGSPFCTDGPYCCEDCCAWSCGIGDGTAPCGNVCGKGPYY